MANTLNEVELLEQRIAALDNVAFAKLRDWFVDFEQRRWDQKIETDESEGRLDVLINNALAEYQSGKAREL
ncbi:MAG: hypothetical protein KGZ69_11075 [Methylomonas sp.]|uniref:Uncharacterized protein n=1 Tax=Methylomonas methanica (strain DSM 25384 / MC09) TaxID=857087 RepID=F9ZXS2_METMM|nr:hypothetical protein [Methylomonas methanica]AEG02227.1 hypothetical protein Metme_3873 [Methylomonas methanica MC09]MBS4051732.1 hypothetical protein [Methylomonas sp.]